LLIDRKNKKPRHGFLKPLRRNLRGFCFCSFFLDVICSEQEACSGYRFDSSKPLNFWFVLGWFTWFQGIQHVLHGNLQLYLKNRTIPSTDNWYFFPLHFLFQEFLSESNPECRGEQCQPSILQLKPTSRKLISPQIHPVIY
jgi:hypothetical protein